MNQFFNVDPDYTQETIDETELQAFEKKHRITFPKTLREELLRINGGEFKQQLYRKNGVTFCLCCFWGIVPEGHKPKGKHRLHPIGDYGTSSFSMKKGRDPSRIFLFALHWMDEEYRALDFSPDNGNPSIWVIRKDGRNRKLADSWDHLQTLAYNGEDQCSIDLDTGWEGYTTLVDETFKSPVEPNMRSFLRNRLGLKDNLLRLKMEVVYGADDRRRYEYSFDRSKLDLEVCRVSRGMCDASSAILTLKPMKYLESRSAEFENGSWTNSESAGRRVDAQDITCGSIAQALKVLKLTTELVYRKP